MIVAIHQPNYLPYLGFFDKMSQVDIFVIYDDAQFNNADFQHRNKIRIFQGWKWLTVPVEKKLKSIKEIKIKNELHIKGKKWSHAHLREIRENYIDSPFYAKYEHDFEGIFRENYKNLIDLNMQIISFLKDAFNIKTKIIFSSELGFTSKSTERLVEIVESLNGDIYLSGAMGINYLNLSLFESKGIEVQYQDFKHPIYSQRYEGFIPNMSSIDALFNLGKIPRT